MGFKDIIKSESGGMALWFAIGVAIVVAYPIPHLITPQIEIQKMMDRALSTKEYNQTMEEFAKLAFIGYELGRATHNVCHPDEGMNPFTFDGTVFCLPDNFCVGHLCVDQQNIFGQQIENKNELYTQFTFTPQPKNKYQYYKKRLYKKTLNVASQVLSSFNGTLSAAGVFGRETHLPNAPVAGTTNNTTTSPICPGGFGCQTCGTLENNCIRVRICPPGQNCINDGDYISQRFSIICLTAQCTF